MDEFEECLKEHYDGKYFMVSKKMTFADVAILCLLRGYKASEPDHYAFNDTIPLLKALEKRLREDPRIEEYLNSKNAITEQNKDSFC